jgi:DNA-binding transcriptional MerR regulator
MVGVTTYSIGQFARLGGVSVRMLRHYDEIGLLRPESVDSWSGYRSYGVAQVPTLQRIVALKELGFTLQQVSTIVHGRLDAGDLHALLVERRNHLVAEIDAAHAQLARIDQMLRSTP